MLIITPKKITSKYKTSDLLYTEFMKLSFLNFVYDKYVILQRFLEFSVP